MLFSRCVSRVVLMLDVQTSVRGCLPECCRSGAYLLSVPDSVEAQPQNGTFWKALPGGKAVFWPMFIVAFLATVVASQSLISAVFQIAYQAIAQGFFPRFHVYHTSRKHKGQVRRRPAALRSVVATSWLVDCCPWRQGCAEASDCPRCTFR